MAELFRTYPPRRGVSVAIPVKPEAKKFKRLEGSTLGVICGQEADMSGTADVKHMAGGATTNERIDLIRNGLVTSNNDILFHESHSRARNSMRANKLGTSPPLVRGCCSDDRFNENYRRE
jgi:hypothetical protein